MDSVKNSSQTALENLLPSIYDTKVISSLKENECFTAVIRVNISSKLKALDWLKKFVAKSLCTFKVDRTYPEDTKKIVFKKEYRCQHNTRPGSHNVIKPHPRHTGCNAKLTITVKRKDLKRSKNLYLKQYPTEIFIKHIHNHPIVSADALRHRSPTTEVEEVFSKLFAQGHSPSTALATYKIELQATSEEYHIQVADGSICPTRKLCYYLYYEIFKKKIGEPRGVDMLHSLTEAIDTFNKEVNDTCALISTEGERLVVAICTPLMKRVHKFLNSSAEIVFLDSSGNMDRHNSRIFILFCATVAGALPLGIFMTYSESDESIIKGLRMLKEIFPEGNSFYGKEYPEIVITDDCTAERNCPSFNFLFSRKSVLKLTVKLFSSVAFLPAVLEII